MVIPTKLKRGDWVLCNDGCLGILKHVFTNQYAPYDEIHSYLEKNVGDIHFSHGQYVIFTKHNGCIFNQCRVKYDDYYERMLSIIKKIYKRQQRGIREVP